jgi:hypothetical protein
MDIKKELEDFENSDDCGDKLIANIKIKEEEFKKKGYLFKIISFSKKLENLIKQDIFSSNGIKFIRIRFNSVNNAYNKQVYSVRYDFFNENRDIISCFTYNDKHNRSLTKPAVSFNQLFDSCSLNDGFSKNFVNSGIDDNDKYIFELKIGIAEEILQLFLSDELKAIYDYNKMQIDVPSNNNENDKRLKI